MFVGLIGKGKLTAGRNQQHLSGRQIQRLAGSRLQLFFALQYQHQTRLGKRHPAQALWHACAEGQDQAIIIGNWLQQQAV